MTKIAIGFTKEGAARFDAWLTEVSICPAGRAGSWFDELCYADWERNANTTIEVGRFYTRSGNPALYDVPVEDVEFEGIETKQTEDSK